MTHRGFHGARFFCALVVMLSLSQAVAAQAKPADEESHGEPGDLPVVHVPGDEPDALPESPGLDWAVSGLVQGDALANTNLPDDQRKNSDLRRARVAGLLDYQLYWRLKASADFANAPHLRDLSVEYRGLPVYIEAGRIVEPFGVLSGSSRTMGFMERPLAEGLAPGYGLGVTGNARGDHWGLTLGLFKSTPNNVQEGGREENAVTIRPTWAPLHKENQVIHLGLEASFRQTQGGSLQFVAIPESVLLYGMNISSSELFVSNTRTGHNKYQLYGAELGMQFGPVLILTEGTMARVQDAIALDFSGTPGFSSDAYFNGYYFETDWAMTGERRDYSTRRGVFSGIDPNHPILQGGIGALELAFRISGLQLEDTYLGGENGLLTALGLNWYPEDHTRLTIEGLAINKTDESGNEKTANAIQLRAQIFFSAP